MLASVSPKMTAHLLVFLGVLLMILSTDKCCGRTGNYLSTASPLIMHDNVALSTSFLQDTVPTSTVPNLRHIFVVLEVL